MNLFKYVLIIKAMKQHGEKFEHKLPMNLLNLYKEIMFGHGYTCFHNLK